VQNAVLDLTFLQVGSQILLKMQQNFNRTFCRHPINCREWDRKVMARGPWHLYRTGIPSVNPALVNTHICCFYHIVLRCKTRKTRPITATVDVVGSWHQQNSSSGFWVSPSFWEFSPLIYSGS